MCLASKYLTQIDGLVENIKSDMKKLQKKHSDCDKAISDIYHKIEVTKFNACEGFYLSKQLQEVLQKRRIVKSEMYRLKSIYDTLHIESLDGKMPKAKANIKKSKELGKEWFSKFGIGFADIEKELAN